MNAFQLSAEQDRVARWVAIHTELNVARHLCLTRPEYEVAKRLLEQRLAAVAPMQTICAARSGGDIELPATTPAELHAWYFDEWVPLGEELSAPMIVRLSALDDVRGRAERREALDSIAQGFASGAVLPSIWLHGEQGRRAVTIHDGRHRLGAARAMACDCIRAQFSTVLFPIVIGRIQRINQMRERSD